MRTYAQMIGHGTLAVATQRSEIQRKIDSALAAGKHWDRVSDAAYCRGAHITGDDAANRAIAAYTKAEKLGELLDEI